MGLEAVVFDRFPEVDQEEVGVMLIVILIRFTSIKSASLIGPAVVIEKG